jgi:hypothetical protein
LSRGLEASEEVRTVRRREIFFSLPGVESRILVCPARRIFTTPLATAIRRIIGRILKTIAKYIANNLSSIKKELHHHPSNSCKIGTAVFHAVSIKLLIAFNEMITLAISLVLLALLNKRFYFCEMTTYFISSLENCSYSIA